MSSMTSALAVFALSAAAAAAQNIVVDATPSHVVNSFSPPRALGGAIDRLRGGATREENEKHTERLLTDPVLKEMLGAGWGTVTYRQNTELMIEAWHWNPRGAWSNPAKQEGYFTGSAEPAAEPIQHSWAYPLPHRGATLGDGNGWSRLTDGDLKSYWKSNPYLTKAYTGDDDSLHPQWVMIDLGEKIDVNAIRIAWADPYARRYYVQFWTGEQEPFYNGINKGAWQTFPMGAIADGKGGAPTLTLVNWKIPARYLRIWMTESSNTCDTHGPEDKRNCVGYAINELYIGTVSADGQFHDIVKHLPSRQQTITWPSSVDPWHAASNLDYGRGDQIGLDFFFNCGVTRGLPAMIPVAVLYTIPEDAANEIAYVYKRKYPVSWIEMGEEADGQRVLPEDYATLYIQFAKAIHKLVPKAPLGGPAFEGTPGDVDSWVDANGRVSFLGRFLDYLKGRGRLSDFTFFSFEHYPCQGGRRCADWNSLYWEPAYVNHVVQAWKDNGLPPNIPFFMTEGNDLGEGGQGTVKSALWQADYVGSMMTAGAAGTYYFHYIANPGRGGGGGGGFLPIDENNRVRYYPPQYLGAQVITKEWAQPVDKIHKLFKVASDVKDQSGNILVTAYALERPDGQWSIMAVNKDPDEDHPVKVAFADGGRNRYFTGPVDRIVFGAAEYVFHPDPVQPNAAPPAGRGGGRGRGAISGHPDPDGPSSKSTLTAGGPDTMYQLPKASIIVLRGKLAD
ncbi:MAG TPA: discoidin domain-containing protein [Candidatus Acidoferrales bacterium]|nr:discoidin domain-containing protein [Candidatus Acidoferrales bacterium]